MSKTLKIFFCILLVLFSVFICATFVHATEEDLNEEEISAQEETEVITQNASDISSLSVLSPSSGTNVSRINSYEEANLHLNNILCILLLAVGVILILLALAILIRLKK